MTTPIPSCQDKLPNCDLYGKKVCVNEYVPWAKENCQHYCGMCGKFRRLSVYFQSLSLTVPLVSFAPLVQLVFDLMTFYSYVL